MYLLLESADAIKRAVLYLAEACIGAGTKNINSNFLFLFHRLNITLILLQSMMDQMINQLKLQN